MLCAITNHPQRGPGDYERSDAGVPVFSSSQELPASEQRRDQDTGNSCYTTLRVFANEKDHSATNLRCF